MIKKGFTIVELLVVIVIISMVMAAGSIGYRQFAQRQKIVNLKRQVVGDIRAAQSDAASGRKPAGCSDTLEGYAFTVTSPTSYKVYADCTVNDVDIKNVTLPTGSSISANVYPVIFRALANGTNLSAGASATITLSAGLTDTIRIFSGGEIR